MIFDMRVFSFDMESLQIPPEYVERLGKSMKEELHSIAVLYM